MTCTPTNINGPFKQHMFLGLSVSSFSTSLDLSGNISELTVRLVEDPCSSEKIYYDGSINLDGGFMPQIWPDPDPGFTYPKVGCPCYFRLSYLKTPADPYDPVDNPYLGFEYCGILQSYEELNDENGQVFVVKLTSPTEILHGVKLILEEYTGEVGQLYNVFNVYGYAEAAGLTWPAPALDEIGINVECPKIEVGGANFGSDADYFGGSLSTSNGIPIEIIKNTMQSFCSKIPNGATNDYNPYGRIVFRGSGQDNSHDGFGALTGEGAGNLFAYYLLDLSELPMPGDLYAARMNGTPSLFDFISEVCSDAGHDWYCEILPTAATIGENTALYKIIRIRTMSRVDQPDLGKIDEFLDELETESGMPIANQRTIGLELRNEVNASFIIGGQKESIYQAEDENTIYPYFGLHENSDTIETFNVEFTNDDVDVKGGNPNKTLKGIFVDISRLQLSLHDPLVLPGNVPTNRIFITIDEIRAAAESEDHWRNWMLNVNRFVYGEIQSITDFYDNVVTDNYYNMTFGAGDHMATFGSLLKNKLAGFIKLKVEAIDGLLAGDPKADAFNLLDFVGFGKMDGGVANNPTTKLLKDLSAIYRFVAGFAAYYGKKFMVKMPYDEDDNTVTIVREDTDGVLTYSEEPTDSGWPEVEVVDGIPTEPANIIGLDTSSEALFFSNEQGKLDCFVKFAQAENKDITESNLPDLWYFKPAVPEVFTAGDFYIKASVETGSFVFGNYSGYKLGADPEYSAKYRSPRAVISIDNPIREKIAEGDINQVQKLLKDMAYSIEYLSSDGDPDTKAKDFVKKLAARPNGAFNISLKAQAYMPTAVALPIKSNVLNYGPWISAGTVVPGQVNTEIVSGLTPWEYGSLSNLYAAGQYVANSKLTSMQEAEKGNIIVPGIPTRSLGAELKSSGMFLVETRNAIAASGSFSESDCIKIDLNKWEGQLGPNITNISCEIGPSGFTTSYEFRTYTPKFNRFGKLTLERFQRNGQNIMKRNRSNLIAAKNRLAALVRAAGMRGGGGAGGIVELITTVGSTVGNAIKTGFGLLFGMAGSNLGSTLIPPDGVPDTFDDDFQNKAIMSLDGLFRPAKRKTDSSAINPYLTVVDNNSTVRHMSHEVEPPLKPSEYQVLKVDRRFLDPFICHSSDFFTHIDDFDGRSNRTHHDIQVLNSSDVPDPSTGNTLSLRMQDFNELSPFDGDPNYRFMALRGPMVMAGWGYDTTGKPIPNKEDNAAGSGGDFSTLEGLKDQFADNFMEHPETWPVGPIDLRFDRKRGVWTCPPGLRIVRARLEQDLTNENRSSDAVILPTDGNTVYDANGDPVAEKIITVHIPFINDDDPPLINSGLVEPTIYAKADEVVVAYYNDVEGKYYALAPQTPPPCYIITFELLEDMYDNGCGSSGTIAHILCSTATDNMKANAFHYPQTDYVRVLDTAGLFKDGKTGCKGMAIIDYSNSTFTAGTENTTINEIEYTISTGFKFDVLDCDQLVQHAKCQLNYVMCPSDTEGTLNTSTWVDIPAGKFNFTADPDNLPAIAKNTYGHAGKAGDLVLLMRSYNTDEWFIHDVKKTSYDVVINADDGESHCNISVTKQPFALENCQDAGDPAAASVSLPDICFYIYRYKCDSETGTMIYQRAQVTLSPCSANCGSPYEVEEEAWEEVV